MSTVSIVTVAIFATIFLVAFVSGVRDVSEAYGLERFVGVVLTIPWAAMMALGGTIFVGGIVSIVVLLIIVPWLHHYVWWHALLLNAVGVMILLFIPLAYSASKVNARRGL